MSPRADRASFAQIVSPEDIRQHHYVRCHCLPRSLASVREEKGAVRNRIQAKSVLAARGKSLVTSQPHCPLEDRKK